MRAWAAQAGVKRSCRPLRSGSCFLQEAGLDERGMRHASGVDATSAPLALPEVNGGLCN